MRIRAAFMLGLAALLLAACNSARKVAASGPAVGGCVRCHGGVDNQSGAPPRDALGRTDPTLPTVGAHSAHVAAGLDCTACHVKPQSTVGHPDGHVDVVWGALATANGTLSPQYDAGPAQTCASVYCHGSFRGGNATNTPVWTASGQGQGACGTCHMVPPPASTGHPQRTGCGECHGGYTSTSVNAATHVNGKVDVLPLACTTCHGDPNRAATAENPQLPAAPPADASGNTDPSAPGVGAHQAHLTDGTLRLALPCIECHAVPASLDGHPNGTVDFSWGTLARTGGANPSFANGACASNYCHGATLGQGGTNHAPSWTGGSSQVACGTCHGVPPPAPHPQNTNCGSCHAGYTSSSVNRATHVNGQPDVVGLSCSSCHGDPARSATALNPQLPAAPPVDTTGSSDPSSPGVGAHQAHLTDGPWRTALACTDCHAVPTSTSHSNGAVDFAWSALSTGGGVTTPSFVGGTCAATYCHGATLGAGGSNMVPIWTGGSTEAACGACHAIPPPASSGHPQNTRCGGCHPGYTDSSVNRATHVNGQLDVSLTCSSCHGDPARAATALNPQLPAAPPVDTLGNSDPSAPGVGAHQAHLNDGPLRVALPCTECHTPPTNLTNHPSGTVTFSWGPLATRGGASPSFTGGTCASTYCHGATLAHGGTNHTPSWTGGSAEVACGTCHGAPPPAPHPQTTACGGCHAGYGPTSVNPATHVNGAFDILPFTCTSCHGDPARANTAQNPQLAAAPPVDTHGNSDPSQPGVGAHQAHLNDGPLRAALSCTDCHAVPTSTSHSNGVVDFAWSALATDSGATTPSFSGGSCSATYCHGSTLGAGGTNHAPSWTGGSAEAACGTCHGAPPPAPHPQNTNCGGCHGNAYSSTTVNTATHVNGTLDLGTIGCTSCHGDSTQTATPQSPRWAAPPVDTSGNTVSDRVGAHAIHLEGSALSSPKACTECHPVPTSFTHATGTVAFAWGPLATGAITPTVNTDARFGNFSTTSPSFSGGTCSSTYCHGSYSGTFTYPILGTDPVELQTITYAGSAASPTWSGTAACGSCHGSPPSDGRVWHSGSHGYGGPAYNDCSLCHPDAAGFGSVSITDPTRHVDGKVDIAWTFSSICLNCH